MSPLDWFNVIAGPLALIFILSVAINLWTNKLVWFLAFVQAVNVAITYGFLFAENMK